MAVTPTHSIYYPTGGDTPRRQDLQDQAESVDVALSALSGPARGIWAVGWDDWSADKYADLFTPLDDQPGPSVVGAVSVAGNPSRIVLGADGLWIVTACVNWEAGDPADDLCEFYISVDGDMVGPGYYFISSTSARAGGLISQTQSLCWWFPAGTELTIQAGFNPAALEPTGAYMTVALIQRQAAEVEP